MSNEYYCITSDGPLPNPEIRFGVTDEESGATVWARFIPHCILNTRRQDSYNNFFAAFTVVNVISLFHMAI